ncbi:MAG: M20/M25/M40 family metallo-hydrolase [Rhodothermaceae bacterium]|nr:M20/M25/M40 family metallo-hydrolase [Rhodothermaceae bacterium]
MAGLKECIGFLQRLIQTPSLPGEEEHIAHLVKAEMEALGYDDVYLDEAGNVIGFIKGEGQAPAVMFNTHLDHVDVGRHEKWPHPPFGGEIHDHKVWGRGAVDIKGPLAAQVYGISRLASGKKPPGDVYVSGVVFEEQGGVGARHMAQHINIPLIVIGEPSSNTLRRGHRGRLEFVLHVQGRSAHASAPERGTNPLYVIAAFLQELNQLTMRTDPDLGSSTVVPTLIRTDQISPNVIPGEVWLTLDWRNIPDETEADVLQTLQPLLEKSLLPGSRGAISVPVFKRTCYTGLMMDIPAGMDPFITREQDPIMVSAIHVLEELWHRPQKTDVWQFATDGGNFSRPGVTCIGFAPGDESLAHTVDEHIPIAQIEEALDANEALARHWPIAASRGASSS